MPVIPPRPSRSGTGANHTDSEPGDPELDEQSSTAPIATRKDTVDELLDYYEDDTNANDGADTAESIAQAPELETSNAADDDDTEPAPVSSSTPPSLPSSRPIRNSSHEGSGESERASPVPQIPSRPVRGQAEKPVVADSTPLIPSSRPQVKSESSPPTSSILHEEHTPIIPTTRPSKQTVTELPPVENELSKEPEDTVISTAKDEVDQLPSASEHTVTATEEVPDKLEDDKLEFKIEPDVAAEPSEERAEKELHNVPVAETVIEPELSLSKETEVTEALEVEGESVTDETEAESPVKDEVLEEAISLSPPPIIPLARPSKTLKEEKREDIQQDIDKSVEQSTLLSSVPSIPLDRPTKPALKDNENSEESASISPVSPQPSIPSIRPEKTVHKEFEDDAVKDVPEGDGGKSDELPNIPPTRPERKISPTEKEVEIPPRPEKTISSDSITSTQPRKPPPPKPKHLSSKIAAFQQMFDQSPQDPVETVKKAPKVPSRPASKLSSDKLKFAQGLRLGGGVPLPGMANPALLQKLQARTEEPEDEEESKEDEGGNNLNESQADENKAPVHDARKSRARPRGKRLPKSAQQAVEISSAPRFAIVKGDLWSVKYSKQPENRTHPSDHQKVLGNEDAEDIEEEETYMDDEKLQDNKVDDVSEPDVELKKNLEDAESGVSEPQDTEIKEIDTEITESKESEGLEREKENIDSTEQTDIENPKLGISTAPASESVITSEKLPEETDEVKDDETMNEETNSDVQEIDEEKENAVDTSDKSEAKFDETKLPTGDDLSELASAVDHTTSVTSEITASVIEDNLLEN